MKKILFPTDFSPGAHKAFQYAINLAKIADATLDVIHVYPEPLKGKDMFLDPEKQRALRIERQTKMEEKMTEFLRDYDYPKIGDKVVYPSDSITEAIVHRSKKQCDLIVMGTKGERNAMDKILGSVTTNTMSNAGCPVLAIPESASFKEINRIIYATSLQTNDKHFIHQLSSFAKVVGATIEFLHVSDKQDIENQHQLMEKELPSEFTQLHKVQHSSVMDGVDDFLRENPSDVLALFIPKRNLWDRLFHKSVSKKMTFHSATPLFAFNEN